MTLLTLIMAEIIVYTDRVGGYLIVDAKQRSAVQQ